MDARPCAAADEVDPGGDVAPLVRPPELEGAAVAAVQLVEVVGLKQLVGELGEGDARVEAGLDDLPGEHLRDREVLADVAQELHDAHLAGPVEVVDGHCGVLAVVGHEGGELGADLVDPPGDDLGRVEGALPGLLGVADLAGGAADEQQRAQPGPLEAAGGHHLHQVAHVQTHGGRVEPDIERDRARVEVLAQCVEIGRVLDEAAPGEVVENMHGLIVPQRAKRFSEAHPAPMPSAASCDRTAVSTRARMPSAAAVLAVCFVGPEPSARTRAPLSASVAAAVQVKTRSCAGPSERNSHARPLRRRRAA